MVVFDFFPKKCGCHLVGLWFFFQKMWLLPVGIFIFFLRFWNLKLDFFPIEKVFRKKASSKKITCIKIIMSEISANLKNIFLSQKTPDFETWNVIFSDRKRFSQISIICIFFHLKFISIKKKTEPFLFAHTLTHSLTIYHRLGVAVRLEAS